MKAWSKRQFINVLVVEETEIDRIGQAIGFLTQTGRLRYPKLSMSQLQNILQTKKVAS